ncbi:hypothetical protein PHSY_006254 [Pseudozyma hubeiensis SY62]|uniref:Uncharacterized protein n=1 Tax=Pseudozyma hubeiensis (strain SY62) TaxID=1305764 RepID=R9PKL1_PSEHS|nr:hypothetical protein PHSY_006254 [Pseudozyma hubeiensis SY62]GAC98660.1 hypothetical protein PHSY_006254 [Pseudozyma hubeiensis SY62]
MLAASRFLATEDGIYLVKIMNAKCIIGPMVMDRAPSLLKTICMTTTARKRRFFQTCCIHSSLTHGIHSVPSPLRLCNFGELRQPRLEGGNQHSSPLHQSRLRTGRLERLSLRIVLRDTLVFVSVLDCLGRQYIWLFHSRSPLPGPPFEFVLPQNHSRPGPTANV